MYMKRCIELASKETGNTYPNPLVGCIIVYKNKIIGQGSHKSYGNKHAEVNAINSVNNKDLLKYSTLYVNLEPCNHHGKTPPCTDLILKHKIKNIVIGSRDPNKMVEGGGIKRLESEGCNVKYGILENECNYLNLPRLIINVSLRTTIRILPVSFTVFLYKYILRKNRN